MSLPYKYFAFISYSRKDIRTAAWLQRKLQWLRFPVKLVEQEYRPYHPRYVRPVFLDKDNLQNDHQDYWQNIKRDLDQSRYLIVLCSPHSARSGPVNDEVRHFLSRGASGVDAVIPVILSGQVMSDGPDACLCAALKELGTQITSRNLPTMVPDEDIREADGWENGFIGATAFMLNVERKEFGSYVLREERRNTARRWAIGAVLAVLVSVAVMQYFRTRAVEREKMNTQEANARLQLQKGKDMCNSGDPGRGILWLHEGLKTCPPSTPALQQIIRMEMGSASRMLHQLEDVFEIPGAFVVTGFSPEGKPVLVSAKDKKLMRIDDGELYGEYLPDPDKVSVRALRADGKMFASSNLSDGLIVFGSLPDGMSSRPPIQHVGAIRSMVFHPKGSSLLVAAKRVDGKDFVALQSYGITDPAETLQFECAEELNGATYSADGRWVVTASQANQAQIFDASTGKAFGRPMPHPGPVFCAAFSLDGRRVVTGCLDGAVRIWFLADDGTARLDSVFAARHTRAVREVSFNKSGSLVLSSSEDGTARLWDAFSGQPFGQPLRDTVEVRFALFSPDDNYVLAGNWKTSARLWKIADKDALARTLHQYGPVETAAFSKDGKLVVTGCQGSLDHVGVGQMWDVRTGLQHGPELFQNGQVRGVDLSSDGRFAATAGNNKSVKIWHTADGSLVGQPWDYGDVVAAVSFSDDNRWMAMTGRGNRILLCDLPAGRLQQEWRAFPESGMYGNSLTFLTDNRRLLVGGSFSARIFSIPDGLEKVTIVHESNKLTAEVHCTVLSPDEKTILTGGINKTALLWSSADGKPLFDEPLRHDGIVLNAAFTPDSRTVATASADGTVKVWSMATGKILYPELTHDDWVQSVAFSRDGSLIATGCADGVARLWRTSDGSRVGAELHHAGPVIKVMFSPSDNTILTTSQDGTARLWTPPPPMTDPASDIEEHLEATTGQELLENHTIQVLSKDKWSKHRNRIPQA